jgi:hypothetical protein
MPYILLGVAIIVLLALVARIFLTADPAKLARGLRWGAIILGGLVVFFLLLSEEFAPAVGALAALLGLALRGHMLWTRLRAAGGPQPGRRSEVETDFLRMTLDHDSGAMSGTVRKGAQRGRRLDELTAAELEALLRQCRVEDEASARLIEAYLERARPGSRDAEAGGDEPAGGRRQEKTAARPGAAMTPEEAYEILGLAPGAKVADIKAAHHRLMLKLHPDQGGSTYLAARINLARDLLLTRTAR